VSPTSLCINLTSGKSESGVKKPRGRTHSGALLPWKIIELPHGVLAAPTNDINTNVALALLMSATPSKGLSSDGYKKVTELL
jgi:hypothetical protein